VPELVELIRWRSSPAYRLRRVARRLLRVD
jgi:hypothetical protein